MTTVLKSDRKLRRKGKPAPENECEDVAPRSV